MSIISKDTWDNLIPEDEKERIIEEYKIRENLVTNGAFPETQLIAKGMIDSYQNLFPKEAFQPQQLTYEVVKRELFKEHRLGAISIEIPTFSDKEAEKLSAIGALLATAKFINKDWKPDWEGYAEKKYYISLKSKKISVEYTIDYNNSIVYFRTEELTKLAVQILGEDTVRLALGEY